MSDTEQNNSKVPIKERTICDGNVVLYVRSDNDAYWQARVKLPNGKWHRFSTQRNRLADAKNAAEDKWREISYNAKHEKIVLTRRFSDVCRVVRSELVADYETTRNKQSSIYIQIIDKYLIPLLGEYQCHNIDADALRTFDEKREKQLGRKPAQSTISNHNAVLRQILNRAKTEGYVEKVPKIRHSGAPKGARDYFTREEWKALTAFMRKDLRQARDKVGKKGRNGLDTLTQMSYEIKELTRDVALILANTGMRSGEEIMNLKWRNLSIAETEDGLRMRFFLPHTKTAKAKGREGRYVMGYEFSGDTQPKNKKKYGVWEPLNRIQQRFDDLKDLSFYELFEIDDYIFRLPSTRKRPHYQTIAKSFVNTLKKCPYGSRKHGMYVSADTGVSRSLYSIRHTFATFRLMDGWTYEDLSKQMGTSLLMIANHYDHLEVALQPERFSGKGSASNIERKLTKQMKKELDEFKVALLRELKDELSKP